MKKILEYNSKLEEKLEEKNPKFNLTKRQKLIKKIISSKFQLKNFLIFFKKRALCFDFSVLENSKRLEKKINHDIDGMWQPNVIIYL